MWKWKITIEMNRWKFESKDNVENWRKSESFDFRYFLRSPVFKLNRKSKKSFGSPRKFFSAVEIEREKKQAASWCYYLPFVVYCSRIFLRNYSISLNREWRKIHARVRTTWIELRDDIYSLLQSRKLILIHDSNQNSIRILEKLESTFIA